MSITFTSTRWPTYNVWSLIFVLWINPFVPTPMSTNAPKCVMFRTAPLNTLPILKSSMLFMPLRNNGLLNFTLISSYFSIVKASIMISIVPSVVPISAASSVHPFFAQDFIFSINSRVPRSSGLHRQYFMNLFAIAYDSGWIHVWSKGLRSSLDNFDFFDSFCFTFAIFSPSIAVSGKILINPAHCSKVLLPIFFTFKSCFLFLNGPWLVRQFMMFAALESVRPAILRSKHWEAVLISTPTKLTASVITYNEQ